MSTAFAHPHHAEVTGHEATRHEATADEVTVDTATIAVITEIEAEVVAPEQHARITWSRPDTGLWAANYGGYYGGTVDRQGTHFFVSDTFGQYVGDFRSLEEAQQRLAERLHVLLPDVRR
jgi:hypothetical protein